MITIGFKFVCLLCLALKAALCCDFCSTHWNVWIPGVAVDAGFHHMVETALVTIILGTEVVLF